MYIESFCVGRLVGRWQRYDVTCDHDACLVGFAANIVATRFWCYGGGGQPGWSSDSGAREVDLIPMGCCLLRV